MCSFDRHPQKDSDLNLYLFHKITTVNDIWKALKMIVPTIIQPTEASAFWASLERHENLNCVPTTEL